MLTLVRLSLTVFGSELASSIALRSKINKCGKDKKIEYVFVDTYVEFTPVIQHGGCCPAARWDPPDETGPSQRAAEQAYRKHQR